MYNASNFWESILIFTMNQVVGKKEYEVEDVSKTSNGTELKACIYLGRLR